MRNRLRIRGENENHERRGRAGLGLREHGLARHERDAEGLGGDAGEVLAAVEELFYRLNLLAKGLKTRRTYTIGLLIPDIQNSFFTSVVRDVEDVALSRGYHLFLCNTDEDPGREDEYITELAKKRVDGLMVASSARREASVRRLRGESVPFVFVDRDVERTDADVVSVNNRAGMRLIAEHLWGLEHRRIAMISGPLHNASGYERHLGLRDALSDLGAELEDSLVRFSDFRISSGREGARELLSLPSPPTAMVTANNQMTLGALLTISEMGLSVPGDVSMVGFDDPEWAPLSGPPLTTVAQPTYEMGVRAARMLLDRIETEPGGEGRKVLLEPWLVVKEFTAPAKRPST